MMMDKKHILAEIRRTADANQGRPLGSKRFETETGVRTSDWYPHHWLRWSDALVEAGFPPNKMQTAFEEGDLIQRYAELIRELGHFPVTGEVRRKSKEDQTFPAHTVLGFKRFGGKEQLVAKIIHRCESQGGWDDVIQICAAVANSEADSPRDSNTMSSSEEMGFVYLIKSGRYYKIGRSASVGRRQYELAIQLPQEVKTIHAIKTDDPLGIEAYWHKRFQNKRRGGEWFELTGEDVKAFKRRRFM
jgi:hypothetical protein